MDPKKAQEMASRVKKMGKGGGIGAGVLAVAGAAVYGLSKSFYTGKSKCMQKGHWFASDITPPSCSVIHTIFDIENSKHSGFVVSPCNRSKKHIKGQNFCQTIDYLSFDRFYQSIKRQICHYFITFSCATFCINKTARCRKE